MSNLKNTLIKQAIRTTSKKAVSSNIKNGTAKLLALAAVSTALTILFKKTNL